MYIPIGRTMDGRLKFRCKRGGNAIEGGHLHIRAGQHPGQKGTLSPRTEHARMLLQDFAVLLGARACGERGPSALLGGPNSK